MTPGCVRPASASARRAMRGARRMGGTCHHPTGWLMSAYSARVAVWSEFRGDAERSATRSACVGTIVANARVQSNDEY